MFNDGEFFLVLYNIIDDKMNLIHMAVFDKAPSATDTYETLGELMGSDIQEEYDFDQCYVALLTRQNALAIFGL